MNKSSPTRQSTRGSVLITAMIICAVIAISLASYLQLGRTSMTIANRALYNNAAVNLAENGLEEAMYSVNKLVADDTYAWPSWTNNGTASDSDAWRKFPGFTFDQNTTGSVRVYVYNYKGNVAPKIVARSTLTLGGQSTAPIEKWIEVTLKKTSKFANGLVAKNSILFNGNNVSVDSWNSDPDNNPATAAIKFSAGVRRDNGSVGSVSVAVDAVLVKQADVWGYVSTGGNDPTSAVGSNGSILGASSVYDSSTWDSANVDPGRVSTDFNASFDPVSAPTKTYIPTSISGGESLPTAADVAAGKADADGNYYYQASDVSFNNKTLTITGKVVLSLTNTTTGINIGGGTGSIAIAPNTGKLVVYTAGDIKIAGNGVANGGTTDATANQPINFQIWGTKTTGVQDIQIAGNGVLSGVIYAPQGDVKINGNGSVMGSIVANNITAVGNANFHYDESLGNFGGGNPYRVSKWKELTTAADRNAYAGILNF